MPGAAAGQTYGYRVSGRYDPGSGLRFSPAKLLLDPYARAFTGKVTFVADVAEFTPKNVQTPEERAKLVFRIKVGLDNASSVFKPGMPADAYFGGPGKP